MTAWSRQCPSGRESAPGRVRPGGARSGGTFRACVGVNTDPCAPEQRGRVHLAPDRSSVCQSRQACLVGCASGSLLQGIWLPALGRKRVVLLWQCSAICASWTAATVSCLLLPVRRRTSRGAGQRRSSARMICGAGWAALPRGRPAISVRLARSKAASVPVLASFSPLRGTIAGVTRCELAAHTRRSAA